MTQRATRPRVAPAPGIAAALLLVGALACAGTPDAGAPDADAPGIAAPAAGPSDDGEAAARPGRSRPAPRHDLPEGVPSDLSVDEVADAVLPVGNRFLPLASEFGLDRYAAASRGTRGGVLFEYLPPNSDLDTWERIGSLFLYRAAPSADEARAILPRYAARMHDTVPIVHHSEVLEGEQGQVFFLHYSAVQGPRREEGLSAIWMPLPGSIANFQLINRGAPFDQREIARFRQVATGLGALDAP